MKASELRVGNWVNFDNLIGGKVNGRDINGNYQITPRFFRSSMEDDDFEINSYYKPIPLTEEWINRLPEDLVSEDIPSWITYIHELQNWYWVERKCKKELLFKSSDSQTTDKTQTNTFNKS